MLPVGRQDLLVTARALLGVPAPSRPGLLRRIMDEADWAQRHRARFRRPHPLWGDGSLRGAAMRRVLARERSLDDPEFCAVLAEVLLALAGRRQLAVSGRGARADGRA